MSKSSYLYLPKSNIYVRNTKRFIKRTLERNGYIGFDTETYMGKCRLICDSENRYVYQPSFKDCIKFIFYRANKSFYRSFWNMDFDISAILKLWNAPIGAVKDLTAGKEIVLNNDCSYKGTIEKKFDVKEKIVVSNIDDLDVKNDDYRIIYLRSGGFFKISKGKNSCYYTDLFKIYQTSLNKASSIFLNDNKIDDIDGNALNTDLEYWKHNLRDIIEYCIKDCVLVKKLGNLFLSNLKKENLPIPNYLVSKASISKHYIRKNCFLPNIDCIPIKILDIASYCYYGGRFELLKKGYFEHIYSYDINSAYPDVMKNLPSLSRGIWEKTSTISDTEIIGYYKIVAEIPISYYSAIPYRPNRKSSSITIFPAGNFGRWVTWYEADLIRPFIKKVVDGYEFHEGIREYRPFKEMIDLIYGKKLSHKDINEILYMIDKIIMNAGYGTFWEKHKMELSDGTTALFSGVLFNPVYASIITAKCRWELLRHIKPKQWKHIIGFHTDSVASEIPLDVPISNELGKWECEIADAYGVYLATGVYQYVDKKNPEKWKSRHRIFSKSHFNPFDKVENAELWSAWENGKSAFKEGLDDSENPFKDDNLKNAWNNGFNESSNEINWLMLLENNKNKSKIRIPQKHVIKIAESLKRWNSLENVNTFIDTHKDLDINSDMKRNWFSEFKNCRDLLSRNISSQTIKINDFWLNFY